MRRVGTMLWVAETALGNLSRGDSVGVKMNDGKVSSLKGFGVPDDFEDLPAYLHMSMKTMQNAMTIISKERDITLRTQRVDENSFRIIRVW